MPSPAPAVGAARFGSAARPPPDAGVLHIKSYDQAGDFTDDYRHWRPMVERSIAWLVADHHRRVRYRSVPTNQLWLSMRVAALNLRRLVNLGLDHNGNWVIAEA